MRLPTPFHPPFQPTSKVGSTPRSNPLPTPVLVYPHTPMRSAPPSEGWRAHVEEGFPFGLEAGSHPSQMGAIYPARHIDSFARFFHAGEGCKPVRFPAWQPMKQNELMITKP